MCSAVFSSYLLQTVGLVSIRDEVSKVQKQNLFKEIGRDGFCPLCDLRGQLIVLKCCRALHRLKKTCS